MWTRRQPCVPTSSAAARGVPAVSRQRFSARTKMSSMSTIAAPMIVPSAIRNMILRGGSPACSQPIETKYGFSRMPATPPVTAARPMRAPTTMPAPKVEVESSIVPRIAILAAAMPPTMPVATPPPRSGHRAAQQHRVGQRAQDVGDRQAGREGQLHAVDQDRRVEHADAGAEHADRQHVQHQLPHRRLREAEPDHRLHQHAEAAHAGDRRCCRLDVVGAVLALDAVAVGDGRAEQPGQHLAADEEADREVHVRRRQPAERAENEDAEREQQRVVLPGVGRGQPAPARRDRCRARDRRDGEGNRAHVEVAIWESFATAGARRRLRRLAPRINPAPTTVKASMRSL